MATKLNIPLPLTLLLPLMLLAFIAPGCSKGKDPDASLISVSPDVLDFGKVRPTDSPVKLSFAIFNNSNSNIVIADIISGCGCTTTDVPKGPISPNGNITVALSINVWGRSGFFEDNVTVKTSTEHLLQIPIRGTIETDIWTDGQALRRTIRATEQRASAVLTVYTVKYPDIIFIDGQQSNGITLTELSRITQNGETAIHLSVDVGIEPGSVALRTIKVVPADPSIAPLMVPFYCHREE